MEIYKNKIIFLRQTAFTILEILLVSVIVAITASITVLSYRKTIKKAGAKEAEAQVELIYDAEAQYALDNDDDILECSVGEDLLSDLGISPNTGSSNFEYGVTGDSIDNIVIIGQAKSSKYNGVKVRLNIDKDGNEKICTKLSSGDDWFCKPRGSLLINMND